MQTLDRRPPQQLNTVSSNRYQEQEETTSPLSSMKMLHGNSPQHGTLNVLSQLDSTLIIPIGDLKLSKMVGEGICMYSSVCHYNAIFEV